MKQIKMMKSKSLVTNIEIEKIRNKLENYGRDEINEGAIQKKDNTADIYNENVNIKTIRRNIEKQKTKVGMK